MALREKRESAVRLRLRGASYSQIKRVLNVSKSSLSLWLRDYPLPQERIKELRDTNPRRIERYRETRRKTREARWQAVREQAAKQLGNLSDRELLIGGLFLYWGEGGKTKPCTTTVSNTDPAMLLFFIRWLAVLGVPKERLRVHVHLYADMDPQQETRYWSAVLGIPETSFRKPYIKSSRRSGLTYTQRFTHGTCNVIFDNRDTAEYVSQALEVLRAKFA